MSFFLGFDLLHDNTVVLYYNDNDNFDATSVALGLPGRQRASEELFS